MWDAARRDSVINSLPLEQQAKMIHTALCLGSKEGIDALRDFVQNARGESTRRRQALQSGAQTDTPHFGVDVWQATKTINSRDSSLAQFSDLYRKVDILDNKVVLSSIAKRVQLAAMAEYRKSLLQEGAGRNQAKDINLHLFHTVYPDHATIRDPDAKGTISAARRDWNRMCNRLREGRMWFEVRHLFGGVGAFLALPPQCVSDRHFLRLPATTFSSWLGLLEVAWRALDMHARRTLNDLVRMSLAGQPLPDGLLAIETLEDGPGNAPIFLSDILTGWSLSEQKSRDDEGESSSMSRRENDGDRAALDPPLTTVSTTNTPEKNDLGLCAREMPDLDDGLLNDIEFDDSLSQEI